MPMDTCSVTTQLPSMAVTDTNNNCSHHVKPKISTGRRSSKRLMEKRRRARINDSLSQLESHILEATNKDSPLHSKLEKADILEMTVWYLRNMQRHQISGSPNGQIDLNHYRLGYRECIGEVSCYPEGSETGVQVRTRLIGHLANRCSPPSSSGPQQQHQTVTYAPSPSPVMTPAAMIPSPQQSVQVQVAAPPTVTGSEIRIVLPPEALTNGQLPSHFFPVYAHQIASPSSPTSSVESPSSPPPLPPTPPHQQPQQAFELPQVTYERPPQVPSMQGVAPITSSPMVACTAPSYARSSVAAVQYAPADVQLTTATEVRLPAPHHELHHELTAVPQQQHIYYQHHEGPLMKPMVQQCASLEENVWRPW